MTSYVHRNRLVLVLVCIVLLTGANFSWAQEMAPPIQPQTSAADTAWVLASSALVLAMIVPGLALFYGGLVRSKNVIGTMMHSFIILCVVSLIWVLFGYSLAFGPDRGGVNGGVGWVALSGGRPVPAPPY